MADLEENVSIAKPTAAEPVYLHPMPILPPGPYRSLGRVLDYTYWDDRDRFLELDALIKQYESREEARKRRTAELSKAA